MDSDASNLDQLVQVGIQLKAFKYTYLVGLVILYFDYLLTFNEERNYFWKRKKGYVTYLFMVNRYYTMLAYVVSTSMIFLPTLMHPVCQSLGDFLPFGTGIPTLLMSGLLVAARVIAVYGQNKWLTAFLITYLLAQSSATLWAFLIPGAGPLPLPDIHLDAFEACIQLTSPRLGHSSVVWIAMDCGFDTIIISLTIFRSWQLYHSFGRLGYVFRQGDGMRPTLFYTLVQDGFLYFLVLITLNVTWMVMVIAASPGLKWIAALPAQCIIVTMVSRITLNLRAQVYGPQSSYPTLGAEPQLTFSKPSAIRFRRDSRTTGNGTELGSKTISGIESESIMELEDIVRPRRADEVLNIGFGYSHKQRDEYDDDEYDDEGEVEVEEVTETGLGCGISFSGMGESSKMGANSGRNGAGGSSGGHSERSTAGIVRFEKRARRSRSSSPENYKPKVRWSRSTEGIAL